MKLKFQWERPIKQVTEQINMTGSDIKCRAES